MSTRFNTGRVAIGLRIIGSQVGVVSAVAAKGFLRAGLVGVRALLRRCFDRRNALFLVIMVTLTCAGTEQVWARVQTGPMLPQEAIESPSGRRIGDSTNPVVPSQLWEPAVGQVSDSVLRELHDLFFTIAVVQGSSLLGDYVELTLLVEAVEVELMRRNIAFVPIHLRVEDGTSDDAVYGVGNGVSAPAVLSRSEPAYTDEARAAGIEGTVTLEAVVMKDGSVDGIKVLESLEPGLDNNATAALSQWTFRPGLREGVPVNVRVKVEIHFGFQ